MTKECSERIKNILDNYHPVLEPGEVSLTQEEAERMVEYLLMQGHDEDTAMDCLKYCTVGSDFDEQKSALKRDKAREKADEEHFYHRMTLQQLGHIGLLGMAACVRQQAGRTGKKARIADTLLTVTMSLHLMDYVEILVHELRKRKK